MLEKDIENLIAQYPDEFFPDSGFKLTGQQVRLGKCIADIVFEDKFHRKIIVEVKRGILSRDASGQIIEYYGLLKSQSPTDTVELILCANVIPQERKMFLETVGIECKQLGFNLIYQIADKVGYTFLHPQKPNLEIFPALLTSVNKAWIFQANPVRYDILNALADEEIGNIIHWEVNQHKNDIAAGHIAFIWLSGNEAGIYALAEIVTNPQLLEEPEAEKKYWTSSSDMGGSRLRVKMQIIKNMLNRPLTKEKIRNVNGLQNLSILKQPRGTNFRVTTDEWYIIKELIEK